MPRTLPYTNVAELLERLGGIPPERVRLTPAPGTATERDLLRVEAREGRLCELVDGTLVEKPMGLNESIFACRIIQRLGLYAEEHGLGTVAGEGGMMRLLKGLVRIPDVAFISWAQLPGQQLPEESIPDLAPDLAVEVLSKTNTRQEMQRKLKEYFLAGTRLVWYVDPKARAVQVFTAPDASATLTEGNALDGGAVLPGFTLPVRTIFTDAPRPAAGKRRPRPGKAGG